jgi:hypothetical protein
MDSIIQESEVVAELIPEVHYSILHDDLDSPLLESRTLDYLSKLVLFSFFAGQIKLHDYDPVWVDRIQSDPALYPLANIAWRKVQVLDNEGTLIIFTQGQFNAQRLFESAAFVRHGRTVNSRSQAQEFALALDPRPRHRIIIP